MENGDFFSRVEFEKLFTELEKNPSEISMCRKLGKHLLLKKGSQDRQNVKKACQLLSRLLYRQVSYSGYSRQTHGLVGDSKPFVIEKLKTLL